MTITIDTDKVQAALERKNYGETVADEIVKTISRELTPTFRDSPITIAIREECTKIVREVFAEHKTMIKEKILATFSEKDFVSQVLSPMRKKDDNDDDD